MPRFNGIPVEGAKPRFAGQPAEDVELEIEQKKPSMMESLSNVLPVIGMAYLQKGADISPVTTEQMKEDIGERTEEVAKTIQDKISGEISGRERNLQAIGKGIAGTAFDVGGEAIMEGLKKAGQGAALLIPDDVEDDIKETVSKGWDWLTSTEIAKTAVEALEGGMETYNKWKSENPQDAKNLESVVNIGLLASPVRSKAKPTITGSVGRKIEKSGLKSAYKQRNSFVTDLVTPERTMKVLKEEVKRTTEKGVGPFKSSIVTASPDEKKIIKEVFKIKDVSPKKTFQGNYNVIAKENIKLAEDLKKSLANRRVFIVNSQANKRVDDAVVKLIDEAPLPIGFEGQATKIANKAKQFIAKNDPTPNGVLQARKEFDSWINSLRSGDVFDATYENALTVSSRAVRQSMNDIIADSVPSTAVKNSLRKQHLYYEAMKNIAPKAAKEANTAIGRAWQNTGKLLKFRGKANQELALMLGIGGLGAAALVAPYVSGGLALAAVTAGTKGLIFKPGVRKGIGKLIRHIDEAIPKSKDPSMVRQLKADRILLVELLKEGQEEETE